MEEVEIKYELEHLCPACLSVGRKQMPLRQLASIYKNITSSIGTHQNSLCLEELLICWECLAILRRIEEFQDKVRRASEMLQLGQTCICGPLSNLTTMTIKDTQPHTIYVNGETNILTNNDKTRIETELYKETARIDIPLENLEISDYENDYIDNDEAITSTNLEIDVIKTETNSDLRTKEVEKPKINRWLKMRAIESKKPKFKNIYLEDFKHIFRKVLLNPKDVYSLNNERDRTYSKGYKCDICLKWFSKKKSLEKHKSSHKKDQNDVICDICHKRFSNKRHLSTHIEQHYYKYECRLCVFYCYNEKQSYKHREKKHKQMLQCLKCDLKFGNRREFFTHYKEWHERFICDYCGVSFKMKYCIKTHIRKQHSPLQCKACDRVFARYKSLWLHTKTHHPTSVAPAYCVECDKQYSDIFRYKWHLSNSVKHNPKRPVRIQCPGCDKAFSKNIYMKDHYNLVHLKQFKYRCEECDKNFLRNPDLVKHRRRVHEGILPPKNKICQTCGRGFTTNKILSNHMRTHSGERPFACAMCPARFAQRVALVGHGRAMHKVHKQ